MKKTYLLILTVALISACATKDEKHVGSNQMVLNFDKAELLINKDVYGHFAEHLGRCVYDGIWVGPDSDIPNYRGCRLDVLEALKKLDIPVLKWPGGCFADTYNWKDGIGVFELLLKLIDNTNSMIVKIRR